MNIKNQQDNKGFGLVMAGICGLGMFYTLADGEYVASLILLGFIVVGILFAMS